MLHRNKVKKLSRKSSHRNALKLNLVKSLIEHGKITTTMTKGKVLKAEIDQMFSLCDLSNKQGSLNKLTKKMRSERFANLFWDKYSSLKSETNSGFATSYLAGFRPGDNAPKMIVAMKGFFE